MKILVIVALLGLSLSTTQGRSDKKFQFHQHVKKNKESSPTLAGLLKKGNIIDKESTSFLVSKHPPPPSDARQKSANEGGSSSSLKVLKSYGKHLSHAKKHEEDVNLAQQTASVLSGDKIQASKIPGDVFYFFGTLLNLEYGACQDGDLEDDLSQEQDNHLVSAKGYVLGECNPYDSPAGNSYMLTVTENIFLETLIVHEVTYEYSNCSGANVTTHTHYPGPAVCVGDFKQFVTTSITLHTLFPRLEDQLFALRTTEDCDVRENLLHFALHNITYNHFSSDMCWTYDHYTLSIQEGAVYDPMLETTIVTQEFEPFDDKKCRQDPVSISGWIVDRCEPLTEDTGMKAVWTSVGAKDGTFYIGVQGYDTYDCDRNESMTGVTVMDMKLPDTCYHNTPIPWMIHEDATASWADYGLDSHSELYGGQICNNDHIFMWKTAETECHQDTKTDFSQCLTYNHYAEDDLDDLYNDDFAIELKSQEIFCHEVDDNDDVCFHVDSTIDYKGTEYTYLDFLSGRVAECSVPHSPLSTGVRVSTSCDKTLRVTDTHLVATTKGFQLAYSLKPGDVLFGDYSDTNHCVVQSVVKEAALQTYFGLNCVHSEVLASGLRASTFGDFHTLPSWFMTYVGGLLGAEYASRVGEYVVAEWYRG
jgi:hypothetical protein